MKTNKYLDRLCLRTDYKPNIDFLNVLQRSHLLNIPFENLDIHIKREIRLSIDKLFEKIIIQKRGGFCYELNGLFYELLISLGFNAKMISARVFNKEKGYGEEFDHLAIIVTINKVEYLTDVGFGEFSFSPLSFELGRNQKDSRGIFLFDKYDDVYFRINKIENGENIPQYIFTTDERKLKDFEKMCNYHQTSSDSHFTHQKAISIPTENGRITLTNNKLKITNNNKIKEHIVKNENDFDKKLLKYFDLKME